jgi:hypothetical protein
MPTTNWTDILLRDSLQDTGTIPSPGYPYTSPDVICTQQTQVSNPTTYFTGNYNSDPNQSVIVNQNNLLYMRGKNLGTQTSGGNCYLYWCPSSLLMLPTQWTQNAMQANVGGQWQPYNTLPQVAGGAISVTQVPFTWSPAPPPAGQHYCTIGAVSTQAHPWSTSNIPTFPNWDSFVMWVRNNQNICWRNITLVDNPNPPEWDRLDLLNNGFSYDTALLIKAQCTNVPIGTTVKLINTALGINTTQVTTSTNQTIYSQGVTCPAGFSGYIETYAQLPSPQTWPAGALITTTAYFGSTSNAAVARYAHDFGIDAAHPHVQMAKSLASGGANNGVLIAVGNCATGYQASV